MKKELISMVVVALMATCSVASAQEAKVATEAEATKTAVAVETEAEAEPTPAEDIAVETNEVPVATAEDQVSTEVIYDSNLTTGVIADCGCNAQPVQAISPVIGCDSCCGQTSFAQPVVYNQEIVGEAIPSSVLPAIESAPVSVVTPAPVTFETQSIGTQCSSCNAAPALEYAPVATTFATAAPVAAPIITPAPVATTFAAPAEATFVSAPVATTTTCDACSVQATGTNARASRRSGRLGRLQQRGLFSRARNAAISSAINDN